MTLLGTSQSKIETYQFGTKGVSLTYGQCVFVCQGESTKKFLTPMYKPRRIKRNK